MYVYNAAMWCGDCAMKVINDLRENGILNDGTLDTWPQQCGDSTEADYPQHCDSCHVFLRNDLTGDGYDYVFESWLDKSGEVVQEWLDYYTELDLTERCEKYIRDVHKEGGGRDGCATELMRVVKDAQECDPEDIDDGDGPSIDVRLRYFKGSVYLYRGSSDYDQDSRGFWGCSSVGPDMDIDDCRSMSDDLLEQVLEHMSEICDTTLLNDWMTGNEY